jgi:acetyltransferase
MHMMARYGQISQSVYRQPRRFDVDRDKVRNIIDRSRSLGVTVLGLEALPVLEAYGIPALRYKMATGAGDALKAAREIGYPVVMKIVSPDIIHKSDVGGVRVGINDEGELKNAYNRMMKDVTLAMPRCRISGVLIQQMATGGKEVILGMNRDPQFGPLMMFGLGGIYVEVLKDVQFRVAPLNREDAYGMVYGIRTHQMLEGTRGEKPSDIDRLVELLERFSQLVTDFPDVLEMDINPVKVYEKGRGCLALDVRLGISPNK